MTSYLKYPKVSSSRIMEGYIYSDVHQLQSNSMDYSGVHTAVSTSLPLPPSFQKSENIGEMDSSIIMANGIDGTILTDELPPNHTTWTTSMYPGAYQHHLLSTPPPEGNGFPPTYSYPPWPTSCMTQPIANGMQSFMHGDLYVHCSSLDESPISSPSSCEEGSQFEEIACMQNNSMYGIPAAPGYNYMIEPALQCVLHSEGQEPNIGLHIPTGVKMPQRKGGIQLWQFLYSLLTSSESKHRKIIEWTSNVHEREFRMLEPESIAIWWGHHKNKPNMSYDKFSRSLRYYYDKGILKKIPGERYVYKFLIDPEHMYLCIGTSDCRPKLKPMPQAAKVAMSKYQHDSSIDFKTNNVPIITQAPEPLVKKFTSKSSRIKTAERIESSGARSTSPIISDCKSSDSLSLINSMTQNSSSMGNLLELGQKTDGSLSMKRCRSLEYANTNCSKRSGKRSPKLITSSMDSTRCPPTLRNSYESFPTDFRDYTHTHSQDAFATSQSCISEHLYVTTMSQSNDISHKLHCSQPKPNAEFNASIFSHSLI